METSRIYGNVPIMETFFFCELWKLMEFLLRKPKLLDFVMPSHVYLFRVSSKDQEIEQLFHHILL